MTAPATTRPLLLAALALAACASDGGPRGAAKVDALIQRGQYAEAVRTAADAVERHPDDAAARQTHRLASVAYLLEEGRRATFDDRDEEALASFLAAAELAPEDPTVAAWVDKTKRKLARRWRQTGQELHAENQLEGAIDAYSRALEYVPDDPATVTSLGEAVLVVNHRAGLSREYYTEGMRALSDYWLEVARSRFSYSHKYHDESERTERRLDEVQRLLSSERVAVGAQLEEDGRWGAARNEYRLALSLDPESSEAAEAFARADVEARAGRKLDEARMWVLRGDLDKAEAVLAEGREISQRQDERFDAAADEIEQARLAAMYEDALHYERDFLYQQAIAAYAALLEQVPYYRDVLTRKQTLEEYVARAKELYQRSRSESGAERLQTLRQIETFWPGYKGIDEELEQPPSSGGS